MMKKTLNVLLASLFTAGSIAGCGGDAADGSKTAGDNARATINAAPAPKLLAQTGTSGSASYGYNPAATSLQFYVNNAAWADLHYTVNGGGQVNIRMTAAGGNNTFTVQNLKSGDVVRYFFTLASGAGAVDTAWMQATTGGSTGSAPVCTLQAESYSSAYDTTAGNTGNQYRTDNVDIEATTDTGAGYNVAWTANGEWLSHSNVTFPTTGAYTIAYRVAAPSAGGVISADINAGTVQLGTTAVPATGGWQNWTTVQRTINVTAGTHSLGTYISSAGFNLNWIRITGASCGTPPPPPPLAAPPANWQEHWFDHTQNLSRVFYNDDIAVYFDGDVDRSQTWMNTYLTNVWRYTKGVYGDFGNDRLFAVFHTGKYSGGHPSTRFDASHDNRNMIDVGPGPWRDPNDLDLITHEVAHIVELGSKGIQGSPAFNIWGDSKWAEIYIYDVYRGLGLRDQETRAYNQFINASDGFPRAGTRWFRDWFLPIYNNYGQSKVLNNYFALVARCYPRNGQSYSRQMNWGEFVHFWSGAAGVNLKQQATVAFGWNDTWNSQLIKAQSEFACAAYPR